ncbi:hypothetical protein E3N88_26703 [Mikania micrantha]|uniref:Uncharacterized protein n=1 Tax=Mikania micrantha TaxID=192012 RepID=A0A5N6MXJ7_9ASTR|nr:hypothetical protein E3N88_26703 [Mikania micrantha]
MAICFLRMGEKRKFDHDRNDETTKRFKSSSPPKSPEKPKSPSHQIQTEATSARDLDPNFKAAIFQRYGLFDLLNQANEDLNHLEALRRKQENALEKAKGKEKAPESSKPSSKFDKKQVKALTGILGELTDAELAANEELMSEIQESSNMHASTPSTGPQTETLSAITYHIHCFNNQFFVRSLRAADHCCNFDKIIPIPSPDLSN